MTMAEQKPWSKIFPPAILSTVIKFDRVHRSMMHCARCAQSFFRVRIRLEMNEGFYFWEVGVRIITLHPIFKLELFAVVWNCLVKFWEKWKFKRLHVA